MKKKLLYCIYIVIFIEIFLRIFYNDHLNTKVLPYYNNIEFNDSSVLSIKDAIYKNFTKRTINQERNVDYFTTYDKLGYRITKPLNTYYKYNDLPKLLFLGCSFCEGVNVNDQYTFPYLLQHNLSTYNIINAGIGGYGAAMACNRLNQNISDSTLHTVIYMYGSFHLQRDVENKKWENSYKKIPAIVTSYKNNQFISKKSYYKRLFVYGKSTNDNTIKIIHKVKKIKANIFEYIYTIRAILNIYENLESILLSSKMQKTNLLLVKKMNDLCKSRKINFIVYSMTRKDQASTELERFCHKHNIFFIYSKVDINDKNLIFPNDNHYNVLGHQLIEKDILNIIHTKIK